MSTNLASTKMMNNEEDLLNSGGQSSTSASQSALVSSNHSKELRDQLLEIIFTIEKDENGQEGAYCKKSVQRTMCGCQLVEHLI